LPDKIHFTAGHKNLYTYDAGGQKLRVVNYSSNRILDIPMGTITPMSSIPTDYTVLTTDYVGNMIYENGALKEIMLPEGYYQNGTFYYYLKDHLGNNRVTINSSGAIVEKSHYYPSGTRFFTESTNNTLNPLPYRYNGKEMEAMNGLNQMDYGARRRFSWGPIWTGVDPLAEQNYSISPYAYCAGNPVNRFDPDGMDWYTSTDGKTTYWQDGNKKVEGYTNRETYTQKIDDNTTITFNQDKPTTMSETVLNPEDFSSQMKSDGSGKKDGEAGNCFVQSEKMVEKSGAKSEDSPKKGIKDSKKELDYISSQADLGKSTRVQVDRDGDGKGDHWVASASVTTDLKTNSVTSVGYFDPATSHREKGTKNSFSVGRNKSLSGKPTYRPKYTYNVVQVRKYKK